MWKRAWYHFIQTNCVHACGISFGMALLHMIWFGLNHPLNTCFEAFHVHFPHWLVNHHVISIIIFSTKWPFSATCHKVFPIPDFLQKHSVSSRPGNSGGCQWPFLCWKCSWKYLSTQEIVLNFTSSWDFVIFREYWISRSRCNIWCSVRAQGSHEKT